jgi:hypothetical protein
MPKTKYLFARDTVSVREPGSKYPTTVHRGAPWHASHPIVVANPDLFSDDPPDIHPRGWKSDTVEQATAAPGEKRTTRRAN